MKGEKRNPLVLVVEDTVDYQESIKNLLEPLKVQFQIVATLMEGIKFAEEHPSDSENPLDLIILDIRIPHDTNTAVSENGGLCLLNVQRIYSLLPFRTPVVVFTAYENYDDCVEAIKAGAYYYVPKTIPGKDGQEDNSRKLLNICRELLFAKKQARIEEEHELLDEKWFEHHHEEVRKLYGGKFVIFLPKGTVTQDDPVVSCVELDGVKILAADSYKKLKWYILDNPDLRKILPLIVFVEGEPE